MVEAIYKLKFFFVDKKHKKFCLMGAWQPSRHTNSVNMKSVVFHGFREPLQTSVTDIQNTWVTEFLNFLLDKYKFIEDEYGVEPVPATSSGLVTPPCPVVTDVSSSKCDICFYFNVIYFCIGS